MIELKFQTDGVPEVGPGRMKGFVIMTRSKEGREAGREAVFCAYCLNAHSLEYEDGCDEKRGCAKDAEQPMCDSSYPDPAFVVEQDPATYWWKVRNRHTGAVADSAIVRTIAEMAADKFNDACKMRHG